ncbi:exonuclease domain-containing protein, partial [Enterobacter sp.]|uniref:3'-5' exonuclease n=1 Tax=Enterobacter sp. TaxID=42895 RepID=UPI003D0D4CD7
YDMFSIGDVTVSGNSTFHAFIETHGGRVDDEAMSATGISLEDMKRKGSPPSVVIASFARWVQENTPEGADPVFVGFNAAFDWSFINYYFIKYAGVNPFGFAALDIKSLYMGKFATSWKDTRSSKIDAVLETRQVPDHNALHDALYQAELFRRIINLQH